MLLHLNRDNVGLPTASTFMEQPIYALLWTWIRLISQTGANIFILISGYFAIRPRVNSVVSLFFQGVCFSVGMYVFWVWVGQCEFSFGEIMKHLDLMRGYWFFGSYIWLMILAPVLNAYAEKVTRRGFGLFLLGYYFFACGMEWCFNASAELDMGYSTLSFVGLYLLGRYVRIHGGYWCELAPRYDLLLSLCAALLSALIAFVCYGGFGVALKSGNSVLIKLVAYISPLCIVASLSLLLFFSKLKLGYIRWVNWLAASSFSVYLLHEEYITRDYYMKILPYVGDHCGGVVWRLLALVGILLGGYVVVTVLDQLRLLLWKKFFSPLAINLEEYFREKVWH